jgi:acyl-CoA synthetase (AMP-forming)/AMP-acid ligase II
MATFPCPQAVGSSTFNPPPLDGSLTLPEIYDHHLNNSKNHPLFVYDEEDSETVQTVTWGQAGEAIHTAARHLRSVVTPKPDAQEPPIIAILAVIG